MSVSLRVRHALQRIQLKLSFEDWSAFPQFATSKSLGRVAMIACILGVLFGVHMTVALLLSLHQLGLVQSQNVSDLLRPDRIQLLLQWCIYVIALSSFHLLEFFVTALYNPYVLSGDSFLINHSIAYTAAALTSWTEYWVRFWFLPWMNPRIMLTTGLFVTTVAQLVRSLAMITCGESFNHMIQQSKKENHVLVTHGIYKILRHPSYFGFYYWTVGTQLLLGNVLHTLLFAIAAWMFFNRRIPYEEECLMKLFPNEYPEYASRTYIGIPFLTMRIPSPRQ